MNNEVADSPASTSRAADRAKRLTDLARVIDQPTDDRCITDTASQEHLLVALYYLSHREARLRVSCRAI